MSQDRFLLSMDERGIATLTLNRAEVANAYDDDLLLGMTNAMEGRDWRATRRCVRW